MLFVLAFFAAYLAGAELGHLLSYPDSAIATFWPPSGLYLAALILADRVRWPWYAAAALAANLASDVWLHDQSVLMSLGFWVANTTDAAVGAALLGMLLTGGRVIGTGRDVVAVVVVGSMLSPAIGATIGTAVFVSMTAAPEAASAWVSWWLSGAIGVVVVAFPVLAWADRESREWYRSQRGRFYALELVLVLAAIAALSVFVGLAPHESTLALLPRPYWTFPLLVWLALRLGSRATAAGFAIVALNLIAGTVTGRGPFASLAGDIRLQGLYLQTYLAVGAIIAFAAAATMRGQLRAQFELREQTDLLNSILSSLGEAVVVADADGRITNFNPRAQEFHRRGAGEIPPQDWAAAYDMYEADGVTPLLPSRVPLLRALRGESTDHTEIVLRPGGGAAPRRVAVTGRPMYAPDGSIRGGVVVFGDVTAQREVEAERTRLIAQLQKALGEIRTLRGFIPICASCKKIRDDQGYWHGLESYLRSHTLAEFSHGLCDDCGHRLYGDDWEPVASIER